MPVETEGPERTAEWIWREFGDELRRFVRRRVADPARVDDVVGEVLLRVHAGVHRVRDDERLAAWVYRIARNAITDEYRRAPRRPQPVDDHELDREQAVAADDWVDDQTAVVRELAGCLRPLLGQLPAPYRRALEMVELEGVGQAEAAAREGVSVSGMKSRVQRGRHRLVELLARCCELTLDGRGVPLDYRRPDDCDCA